MIRNDVSNQLMAIYLLQILLGVRHYYYYTQAGYTSSIHYILDQLYTPYLFCYYTHDVCTIMHNMAIH